MFVKICGLTSKEAIDAAAAAGADAVGFVFANSPRKVSPRDARALAADLPEGMLRVAVFRHPEPRVVAEVLETLEPDWLQTDAEDFARLKLPDDCLPMPVYRNGSTQRLTDLPVRLLFEGPVSGRGRIADWHEAQQLAARTQLVLAGGLSPDNVEAAIRTVRPWGIDVSSGVERAPGVKDPTKIHEFVVRARATAETLERKASGRA